MPQVLYTSNGRNVYRMSDLYLPSTDEIKKKMLSFNYERMANPFDMETEATRNRKRKLKEDLKHRDSQIKNALKYCNVTRLARDAEFMYAPMSEQRYDAERGKKKYVGVNNIGRILPRKRVLIQHTAGG